MKTAVYVDGFNLYYGCLKGTTHKWLDLRRFCQLLLPSHQVSHIKYFAALIHARDNNPRGPMRQAMYLRAIATLPEVEVIFGHFRSGRVSLPLADSLPERPKYVTVMRVEEKGSDVNLAAHLVHDGHRGSYDLAVVISNDSDLAEAMRLVRQDLGLPVGLLNPHRHPSAVLRAQASFYKPIREGVLRASQFPAKMRDAKGTFTRPREW